jgi:hypothetical protein
MELLLVDHSRPTVSVVLPTLNEAPNLPLIFPHLPLSIIDEVILVDGRSTDDTVAVARRLLPTIKVVSERTPGKGAALRAGYAAATGDIIIVLDADGSNDPREIPRFVRALVEGADFVKGSRFAAHGGTTDMPRYRKAGNKVFVHLVNTLFNATFTDLCYGYHAFWRHCLGAFQLTDGLDGFEIDTALYLRALRQSLRLVEVASFEGYRFHGIGKLQTIPDGWRVLRTIGREWLAKLKDPHPQLHLGFRTPPVAPERQPPPAVPAPAYLEALFSGGPLQGHDVDLLDLIQRILRLTMAVADARSGSLVLVNQYGEIVHGYVAYEDKLLPLSAAGPMRTNQQGLAGWVLRNGQPALVQNTRDDPRWYSRAWEQREGRSRSAMALPLSARGRLIGAITLVHPESGQFTEHDLERVDRAIAPAKADAVFSMANWPGVR